MIKNPQVTVLLSHHLNENDAYLQEAIRGVLESEGVELELIVLADTPEPPQVPEGVRLVHDRTLINATRKVIRGMELSNPNASHVLILSDDVILTRKCLSRMMLFAAHIPCIMNPMSNSDSGSRYVAPVILVKDQTQKQLIPDMGLEELKDWQEELRNFDPIPFPLCVRQEWVGFFCTLIHKDVWKRVGALDEDLEYRHNDQDYCMRAYNIGIPVFLNFSAFAFHYGSKTLSKVAPEPVRRKATEAFQRKWGAQAK